MLPAQTDSLLLLTDKPLSVYIELDEHEHDHEQAAANGAPAIANQSWSLIRAWGLTRDTDGILLATHLDKYMAENVRHIIEDDRSRRDVVWAGKTSAFAARPLMVETQRLYRSRL